MTEIRAVALGSAIALIVGLAAGGTAAWLWQANAYTGELATQAKNHQADIDRITLASDAQVRTALEQQKATQKAAAENDAKYTKERDDALAENERLRRAVDDGGRRLRVAGTCSSATTSAGNLPGAASASSVGDAGTVELSATAGRNVLDIREGIVRDQSALRALQGYIRASCLK